MFIVRIYTMPKCQLCSILKNFFDRIGIRYLEVDVSNIDVMADLIMKNIFITSVPVLEINGRYYFTNDLFSGFKLNEDFIFKILKGVNIGQSI